MDVRGEGMGCLCQKEAVLFAGINCPTHLDNPFVIMYTNSLLEEITTCYITRCGHTVFCYQRQNVTWK
jgi:hypothetical protein